MDDIIRASEKDEEIQSLISYLRNPKVNINDVKNGYEKIIHEFWEDDGLLLRGDRIVIPKSLQKVIVAIAHEGHMGIVKTKQYLRSKIWFEGMDKKVEAEVKSCLVCLANNPNLEYEPLSMSDLPDSPWEKVAIDFKGPVCLPFSASTTSLSTTRVP